MGFQGRSKRVFVRPGSVEKVCKFWAEGRCVKGDGCQFLHSWFRGDLYSDLASLQGHKKILLYCHVFVW